MTYPVLANLNARRIIILRALNFGDLLCAVPAFRALRHRFPAAEISLIGLPWTEDLIGRLPYFDRLLPSPGFPTLPEVPYEPARTGAFYAACRQEQYDLGIQLQGSGRTTNEYVALCGPKATIGFTLSGDSRVTATVPWIEEENEILRCLRLIALLGADTTDPTLEYPVSPAERRRAQLLLNALPHGTGPIVALHPGARDPRRRWPPERFAALGDALQLWFGARIVLTGSADDRPLGETIRQSMRVSPLDLIGQTDLGTFAALIANVDLLVTNDTGSSHLAVVTRTPSVVLFSGVARPERWAPLDRSLHTVIDAVTIGAQPADLQAALLALPVQPVWGACCRTLNTILAVPRRPITLGEQVCVA